MKSRFSFVWVAGIVTLMLGLVAVAQPDRAEQAKPEAEANADTPGAVHEKLMKLAGEWNTTTKFEMAGMDAQEAPGTAKIEAALGGRFLRETSTGEMQGAQTESSKFWGYNAATKKFEGIWAWTMSTGLLHVTGSTSDDLKTIEWDAWYEDGTKKEEFKVKTTFIDNDHFTVVMYGGKMPDGSAGPTMTSTYTRKK